MLTLNEAPDGLGNVPDEPPPEGLDWDLWCGPLPLRPYNPALFVGGHHRYFADLVGSWLHEMGPHIIDLPVWALELGPPKTAFAAGGKFVTNDISTIPDTMEAVFEYDDFVLTWSNQCANSHGLAFHKPGKDQIQRRLGVSFHGVNGTLLADYDEYWLVSEGSRIKDPVLPEPYLPRVSEHPREFLDCIRTRELPSCDVEEHYPLAVLLNLGNIAYKVGRKIRWDAENERIIGDREADELATPKYREPWKLPV
jgi:predicted dehydrogenase